MKHPSKGKKNWSSKWKRCCLSSINLLGILKQRLTVKLFLPWTRSRTSQLSFCYRYVCRGQLPSVPLPGVVYPLLHWTVQGKERGMTKECDNEVQRRSQELVSSSAISQYRKAYWPQPNWSFPILLGFLKGQFLARKHLG